jgi:glycosidase
MRLVGKYGASEATPSEPWSQKDALLITYGDSIRGEGAAPLAVLHEFLKERVGDLVSFIHILPFYPYSSDDGFAVEDFRQVDASLGGWEDIERLARDYRLVFDGVINHVSASSVYMKRYAAGDADYEDFFISLAPDTDTSSVLRTRNLPLFHDYETSGGKKWLWTTFGRDQVDLNFRNPKVLLEVLDVLLLYAVRGARVVRLDAIPYLWKELGTSCAHLPQTHELIKLIRDVYDLTFPEVLLLTETNVPHRENVSYFGQGGDEAQMIYNFTLPPMVLFALANGSSDKLNAWAKTVGRVSESATYLNVTATHDGIGMRPTEGILGEKDRRQLVDMALAHNGRITGKRNSDGSVAVYELNLNYFDAVNDPTRDEPAELAVRRFMVSQAIALAFIGIPGIYLHSLVGSRNDDQAVKDTGIARRINRAKLSLSGLCEELDDPSSLRARVFSEYARLLAVRRREKAFHPNAGQEVLELARSVFAVKRTWAQSGEAIIALHNLSDRHVTVQWDCEARCLDLLAGGDGTFPPRRGVPLGAYQVRWLKLDEGHS